MEAKSRSVRSYLRFMLKSPINAWWVTATFVIEVLGIVLPFVLLSDTITLSRLWLIILLLPTAFLVSFSILVAAVVLFKGWEIFSETYDQVRVLDIIRVEGEQVFLLEGIRSFKDGSVFEIYYQTIRSVEVSLGLVKTVHQQEDGIVQAKLLWIKPGRLRDIETNKVLKRNLIIRRTLSSDIVSRWITNEANIKLELHKRGIEE